MRRTYADVSDWRAPFDSAVLQGLGVVSRHYADIANFRAGYDDGYSDGYDDGDDCDE